MDPPKILFEDNYLIVISKPSGMVVNRAKSVKGKTVQDWVVEHLKMDKPEGPKSEFVLRSGIVHRLDKETSGVLLIAKDPDTFFSLQKQFKDRKVEKHYQALLHGQLLTKTGLINAPVGRLPWNRERFGVFPGGRSAQTAYKVLKEYARDNEKYTLLEFLPKTGRTHQIRVHAKSIGHPIVGDIFYAGRKTARRDRVWCPRLFLHASEITFQHPKNGQRITVKSPLPSELRKALAVLESN